MLMQKLIEWQCKNDLTRKLFLWRRYMPVASHLRILLARLNVERAQQRKAAISLRRLAQESGIALSVLVALHTGKSQRIDYATVDRLLTYFNRFFPVSMNDLLVWEVAPEDELSVTAL
jgi:DNA-binding Xre family transcriptional regulator